MKTILLVNSDLGFIFWLGQSLDSAGYEALPAKSVSDAMALIVVHGLSISLLVVSASLAGAGSLIEALRNSQTNVKVIALSADVERDITLPGVDVWRSQPGQINEGTKLEWLQLIETVLSDSEDQQYRIATMNPD